MEAQIDAIDHPLMRLTQSLLHEAGRKEHKQFIIDDPENISAALEAGIVVKHLFCYGEHAQKHPQFFQQLDESIKVYPIRPRTCKKIFGTEKQARIFAIADIPETKPLSALQGDIAVLDGLMMMGNMGAIMRSALAFDIGGLAMLDMDYLSLFDRRLIRASKGYLFKLPMVCLDAQSFFAYCQEQGIKIVNCSHDATATLESIAPLAERLAMVLGAEKTGVSELTREVADYDMKIPFNSEVESLNVSVAAAIIFYARYHAPAKN